jgi:hypothetical protein
VGLLAGIELPVVIGADLPIGETVVVAAVGRRDTGDAVSIHDVTHLSLRTITVVPTVRVWAEPRVAL